jgi:hypothetical protein
MKKKLKKSQLMEENKKYLIILCIVHNIYYLLK